MARKVITSAERVARSEANKAKRLAGHKTLVDSIGRVIAERYGGINTDLTPELLAKIVELTEDGNFPHHAAQACMVPLTTWKSWMAKGRKGEEPFATAYISVESAKSKAIAVSAGRLHKAGLNAWQADARFLESVGGDTWMRTEKRMTEEGDSFKGTQEEIVKLRRDKMLQDAKDKKEALVEQKVALLTRDVAPKKLIPNDAPITPLPGSQNPSN